MTDNKFVEEDFERMSELDQLYLWEKECDIAEEYMEWQAQQDEKQRRKAAIIEVVMELKKEQEHEKR